MKPRDPNEEHRQASFLELFFDLCFVVAIAQAAAQLHHAIAEDHVVSGIISFSMVFFAIWWAWMNFTWFASAYDNDDIPFRIATFIQIAGALILAAGVQQGFVNQNFNIIFIGYLVMRVALASLWIRAAFHDPSLKTTNLRYAIGICVAMIGWGIMFAVNYWPFGGFLLMAVVELAVPAWAEYSDPTPWHPEHIAERYGLLTIIVLGESVLAATNAVQIALGEQGAEFYTLLAIIAGGLLILFSFWWLYFSKSAHQFLTSRKIAFLWGYGHYFIFGSVAAVGAGIAVNIDHTTAHTAISDPIASAAITVPVAFFLVMLWIFHIKPHKTGWRHAIPFLLGAAAVLAVNFISSTILITGLITTGVVIYNEIIFRRNRQTV
ncbi:low temperature requirement protein A [Fodinibius saliphilus]|uniref:low temperature requirement protein A n=1 Tax=Fodinibius saliphilus TaxID=1920650 RepID=UPI001109022C|nr:low temperature requirement protein A [Fodinibius saliphilus]